MDWASGTSRCRRVCIEKINKILLCGTGNCIQYLVINHHGKEHKENAHMCVPESLCCLAAISATLQPNYTE